MPKKIQLSEVVITEVLNSRQSRVANLFAENSALTSIAAEVGRSPETALKSISQTVLELAAADAAGVSVLEEVNGEQVFKWDNVAGEEFKILDRTTPIENSPCGDCVKTKSPQLYSKPNRYYQLKSTVAMEEVLTVPILDKVNNAIGAIWVVSTQPSGKFDREDVRLLTAFAGIASAAFQLINN
jgi:GAF domain-containing protein